MSDVPPRESSSGKRGSSRATSRGRPSGKTPSLHEALHASEQAYRATLNSMGDAIHVVDPSLRIMLCNRAFRSWCRRLGLSGSIIGRTVFEVFPFLPDRIREEYDRVYETRKTLSTEETTPVKGRTFVTETRKIPIIEGDRVVRVVTVVRDITQRKQAEAALERRADFKRLITELSTRFISMPVDDLDEAINDALRAIGEFAGVDRSYLFQLTNDATQMSNTHEWCADGIVHQVDRLQSLCVDDFPLVARRLRQQKPLHVPRVAELPVGSPDRKEFEAEGIQSVVSVPMVTADALVGFVGFDAVRREHEWSDEDISLLHLVGNMFANALERKRAEAALRREHDFITSLIDTAHTIILVLDAEAKIVSFNPYMEGICGYALTEVKGRDWFEVFIPEGEREHVRSVFERTVVNASSEAIVNPIVTRDGRERQIEWYSRTLRDGKDNMIGVLATGQDVTERRHAEELMLERSRLEVTETLAGGIAHDFNNLLTGVLGNAELLKMTYPDNADAMRMVEGITKSARRAVELAQQLVAFARGGKFQLRVVNVNDVIRETVDLLHGSFPPGVLFREDLAPDLHGVEVDPGQIRQVVMNLITNAVEAVGDEGRITLTTYNYTTAASGEPRSTGVRPGPSVCFSVGDTGPGMDTDTIARVFEPFYSTKSTGRGLGLAAAYGIVKNHGGVITAHSEVDVGTVFLVQLPAVMGEREETGGNERATQPGDVTVLVVDDEETVLDVTRRMIRHLGYRVITAVDGREAVRILQTHEGAIELVILDIEMPVMSGVKAYPLLKEARPDTRVIISSGYEMDAASHRLLDAGADAFLQKPFRLSALSQQIQDVLSR